MLELEKIDFKKMGFRAGIEVHHQIKTKRKLFCNCPPILCDGEPDYLFERYFRPVLGEMGDFDAGMLIEFEKGYRVIYHAYEASVCNYEQDEQPPFWPDYEGIYMGYELAHWLNFSALVDEVVVSRKQYLDGSITTGFQRTMIVARDGWVPVNGKKIKITNLTVEEDAARKIKTENFGRTVYYNLDRLGIPLVEVISDHEDCDNPDDFKKLAEYIGLTLRLSGIAQRGIGSVRQDVNFSIKGGNRVEIKGVQDLDTFVDLARREVARQDMLIKIADMLKERGLTKEELEHTYIDFTENFDPKIIPKNYILMGIRIPKLGGIYGLEIQPSKDFGQDVIEKTELISGIPRSYLFHSDEINQKAFRRIHEKKMILKSEDYQKNFFFQNLTIDLNKKIRKILNLKKDDAYFLALGPQKWVIHALKKVIERTKMALDGVPQETRRFLPDNNTEFLRVIHGQDRLYPDTDTPPIDMDMEKIQKLREKVGERPWEIVSEFEEKYGFSFDQTVKLIRHDRINDMRKLIEEHNFDPNRCYVLLEETILALTREGLKVKALTMKKLVQVLKGAHSSEFDFNQIQPILRLIISNPKKDLKQILSDLKIKKITEKDIEHLYDESLKELEKHPRRNDFTKDELAEKVTGNIMRRINGGFSGKRIFEIVLSKLEGN
ncbi:MAG: Glu-tRNA(Gln) amidotransferase subunit GatE [Candidatus Heimdallarchaeota archaeon]|nr:Glu-tRNA(Gln) amidotransferase subunit GatE [Candidatus Heimdallarchaeota archaeon]MBY8993915.1 Glu-tRNA(Gln) amidotransferase subunit GatE [Candidatus Heimdallarchaeota archaeon]